MHSTLTVSTRADLAGGRGPVVLKARWETEGFDEGYISALRDGDPEAEARFLAQFRIPIWVKARRQLRYPDLVEDACQETLWRVLQYFRSGKRLKNPQRLPAFVQAVCHNVTLEMIRSRTRHRQMPELGPDPPDFGPDPHDAAVTQERKQLVRQILARLPEKDRDLLRLAMLEELDKAELCRRFQTSEAYLRVLLHRARARFRDEFGKRSGAATSMASSMAA